MNSDTLKGQWKELKGRAKAQWAKLTDDDIDLIDGRVEELIGRIQKRYGESREQVRSAVDRWMKKLQPSKS